MTINSFDLQFFELAYKLKQPLTDNNINTIKSILLKLNNPTYYNKYVTKHPASVFGYYKNTTINPILVAVSNMLKVIKSTSSLEEKLTELQKEYSWAYNNYIWYNNLVTNTK